MKKIFLTFFVFLIMFIVTAKADLVKPNIGIKPYQVVKIQLSGLMKNDEPNIDNGIKQTWEFAHPNNQKNTGPLENFKTMLKVGVYIYIVLLKIVILVLKLYCLMCRTKMYMYYHPLLLLHHGIMVNVILIIYLRLHVCDSSTSYSAVQITPTLKYIYNTN